MAREPAIPPGSTPTSAAALKLTAPDLLDLRIVDEVIPEPPGGAHDDPAAAAEAVRAAIVKHLAQFKNIAPAALINQRYDKFRDMGIFKEGPIPTLTPPPLPKDNA